jgi:hypothetical protein
MQTYKNMTPNDLQSGMIITTRNGFQYLVIRNDKEFNAIRKDGWIEIKNNYNDDFTHKDFDISDDWDIVKVEHYDKWLKMVEFEANPKYKTVLWEEATKVKLTLAEIESRLGYKIEIVSDNEEE